MPLIEEMEKHGTVLFRWRSYLPLLLVVISVPAYLEFHRGPDVYDHVWEILCLTCGFLGLTIRAMTIGHVPAGTSGRNTKSQIADELNTTGMYSLVRNPLYLGNYFMWLAPVIFLKTWWLVLVYSLIFLLYYERIIFAEEQFLRQKFGEKYMEWASRTPMIVPGLRGWKRPSYPFSFRTVLRREYHGLCALVTVLYAMEILTDLWTEGHQFGLRSLDLSWMIGFGLCAIFYVTVRIISKKTTWLRVDGRP
ncbi:MAG: isoprenylcysteine carboxylmethyltransferase family protein [Planctomycetia bacterium]|nr:isoprenylcysteine carboxylmethyltransferase family protein [Planctomycetia bacterium]